MWVHMVVSVVVLAQCFHVCILFAGFYEYLSPDGFYTKGTLLQVKHVVCLFICMNPDCTAVVLCECDFGVPDAVLRRLLCLCELFIMVDSFHLLLRFKTLQVLRFTSITLLALHRMLRPANRLDPMRTVLGKGVFVSAAPMSDMCLCNILCTLLLLVQPVTLAVCSHPSLHPPSLHPPSATY